MAKGTRNLAMATAAAAVFGTPAFSVADDAVTVTPATQVLHVRSTSPKLVMLIRQAAERSATFRGLVATINASDSFAFIEEGDCGRGVRACFVGVTASKTHRFMWVTVDTRKADWDLMGSIAHELRHVIEVIGEPGVRDNVSMYFFYEVIGTRWTAKVRETQAAVDAGRTVRAEVRRFDRQVRPQ